MVPVTTAAKEEPGRSWWDLLRTSRTHLRDLVGRSPFDGALARFFLRTAETTGAQVELPPLDVDTFLATYTANATNAAALGFILASGGATEGDAPKKFLEGFDRCMKQEAPPSGPSVHSDPKLLLGLAAGIAHMQHAGDRKAWLEKQLTNLVGDADITKSAMAAYSLALLGNDAGWRALEGSIRKIDLGNPGDAATVLWSLQIDPARFSDASRGELNKVRQQALQLFPLVDVNNLDACTSTLVTIVASRLLNASVWDLDKTAFDRLIEILIRFPAAMAREDEAPKNEYAVQRILWTMLAGVYPDVRDEQWLSQFGVYQPRTDLAIESMKTVIEAKYIRSIADFRKIQNELISDATMYTKNPEVADKVIAVIYDDTSTQSKYDQMRTDLEKVKGIARVIILSKCSPRPTARKTS